MSKTNIEWTQETWNPIVGCSIVSPGCAHCYAMKMAARIEAMNLEARAAGKPHAPQYDGTTTAVNGNAVWTGKLARASDKILTDPLRRKKPTTYFVNSMGDLFHEDIPFEWIRQVFGVMARCPHHTFQILTKRAARMREVVQRMIDHPMDGVSIEPGNVPDAPVHVCRVGDDGAYVAEPLPNVWLGVSTERQQEADERIPLLLRTPAAVRFISAEPLLGPIDLTAIQRTRAEGFMRPLDGRFRTLDWVIAGGESGPDARPMHPDWARGLRDQCAAAGVPFFFKQWGAWRVFYDRNRDDPDWRNVPQVDNQMNGGARRWVNLAGGIGFHGERLVAMENVGKSRAGRLLDGVIHNGMPGDHRLVQPGRERVPA